MNFKLKLLQHLLKDNTQGLTIIEGLLAIVIVTLLIVAIGPVLAFAAATRIQARRVELASQVATAYLDSVRAGSIPQPIATPAQGSLNDVPVPGTGSLTCNTNDATYPYCTSPIDSRYKLYCADRGGNPGCSRDPQDRKDFLIQASQVLLPNNNGNSLLGIRVYRGDAFVDGISLQKTVKSSVLAGGSGSKSAPVVELTTELPPSQ